MALIHKHLKLPFKSDLWDKAGRTQVDYHVLTDFEKVGEHRGKFYFNSTILWTHAGGLVQTWDHTLETTDTRPHVLWLHHL